ALRHDGQTAADELFAIPAESVLGGPVPAKNPRVVVDLEDRERRGFDDGLEALNGFLERPLQNGDHSGGDQQGGGREEPLHRRRRDALSQRLRERTANEDERDLQTKPPGDEEVGPIEGDPEVEELVRARASEVEACTDEQGSGRAEELEGARAQMAEVRTRHEGEQKRNDRGGYDGQGVAGTLAREGGRDESQEAPRCEKPAARAGDLRCLSCAEKAGHSGVQRLDQSEMHDLPPRR